MGLIISPFSVVFGSICPSEYSNSINHVILPLSTVHVAITKVIASIAMLFTSQELTLIKGSVRVDLLGLPLQSSINPLPLRLRFGLSDCKATLAICVIIFEIASISRFTGEDKHSVSRYQTILEGPDVRSSIRPLQCPMPIWTFILYGSTIPWSKIVLFDFRLYFRSLQSISRGDIVVLLKHRGLRHIRDLLALIPHFSVKQFYDQITISS